MHKYLREDSLLGQHGNSFATPLWFAGDLLFAAVNPLAGGLFVAGNIVGTAFGQTKTGSLIQNSLASVGCVVMTAAAVQNPDLAEAIGSGVSGFLLTMSLSQMASTNYEGSVFYKWAHPNKIPQEEKSALDKEDKKTKKNWVQSFTEPVTSRPTKVLQNIAKKCANSTKERVQAFGATMLELTQRPLFQGNLFTTIVNLGLVVDGISKITSDVPDKVQQGLCELAAVFVWAVGNSLSAVSKPEDGRKNIYRTWAENALDCVRGKKSAATDNKPQPK